MGYHSTRPRGGGWTETAQERSGGTCCFSSGSRADTKRRGARLLLPWLIQVVAVRIGCHGEAARHALPCGLDKMPSLCRRINDIAFRGYERLESFNGKTLLATQDGPDLSEICVVMSQIACYVLNICSVAANNICVGTVLADREVAPGSAPRMFFLQLIDVEE